MIVVSDASPLISLAVTGHLELLKHLYERVLIPDAIYQELTGNDPALPGTAEVQTLEWIISQPVQNEMIMRTLHGELDYGEAATIALAVERQVDVVLIDERRARAVATRLGLKVVGVLGVLVEAKHKTLIPHLKPILDDLITRAGFWVSGQLYERVLQAVGESQ